MAEHRLTARTRARLPGKAFALDGKERRYPIHDEAHARNALARVRQFGTPEEQREVQAAVHRRFPGIEVETKAGKPTVGKASAETRRARMQRAGRERRGMRGAEGGAVVQDVPFAGRAPVDLFDEVMR